MAASTNQAYDNPPPPLQLSTYQGHYHNDHNRIFDYIQKYPVDKEGKERHPDSRTWKVYIDEHESYDYDMVKGFRDNIDALLVFAALFSSVITGFVVPAVERLEPDHSQISTHILFEVTQLLRANGNATLIKATPPSELRPDSITHTSADVWVACLFFSSLSLSLSTAFVCILVKQWLQAFTALVPGDAKRRSLTRQFRFGGLQRWKFSEIVGFLPLLLHLTLALFLIGVCVYVHRYHLSILSSVGFVSATVVVFYIVTSALPAVHLDCPYRIPILYIPASACIYAWVLLQFVAVNKLWLPLTHLWASLSSSTQKPMGHASSSTQHHNSWPSFTPLSLTAQERDYVEQYTPQLELASLEWLYNQTTNTSVHRIVLPALARVLDKHVCPHPGGAEPNLHIESQPLEDMWSFALAILDNISGPEWFGDDIPQLLDFFIYSSQVLHREILLPESRWLSLIQSPHLESLLERHLLPLDVICSVTQPHPFMGGPLHVACRIGHWDNVKCLLRHCPPSQLTEADSLDWLPLGTVAASPNISIQDFTDIVRIAMSIEDDILGLPLNRRGDTILHILCEGGAELSKFVYLAESSYTHGASWWNIQREDKQTPLHRLCSRGENPSQRVEIAKYLLSKGADLGMVDEHGWTPLHSASLMSHSPEIVQALCSHLRGVKNSQDVINHRAQHGSTALHLACISYGWRSSLGSTVVEVLISAGADANAIDDKKRQPLHIACDRFSQVTPPNIAGLEIILDKTFDINLLDCTAKTPLDLLLNEKNASKEWQRAFDLMREKGAKLASELEFGGQTVGSAEDVE